MEKLQKFFSASFKITLPTPHNFARERLYEHQQFFFFCKILDYSRKGAVVLQWHLSCYCSSIVEDRWWFSAAIYEDDEVLCVDKQVEWNGQAFYD